MVQYKQVRNIEERRAVFTNLHAYKQKYYKGLLLRGILFTLLSLLGLFIFGGLLEYSFWFNPAIRTLLLFAFVVFSLLIIYKTIIVPSLSLLGKSPGITDEDAAKNIGHFYDKIDDRLLNLIQLNNSKENNSLIAASIGQRSHNMAHFPFDRAINLKDYLKTAPYLLAIFILIVAVSFWKPSLLIDSTGRIANFHKKYSPPALFRFSVLNNNLTGYKNENFTLSVSTHGSVVPEDIYLILPNRKVKLIQTQAGLFSYEFVNPQRSTSFYLESAGIKSDQYLLKILTRPSLKSFSTRIIYPAYINRPQEIFDGVGNLTVPEGSEITWQIQSISTDSVIFNFKKNNISIISENTGNQMFKCKHLAKLSDSYEIKLLNAHGLNKNPVIYSLEVIEDQFPKISVEHYQDTTFFHYIILNGKISDDYGLKNLMLYYKSENNNNYKSAPITITASIEQPYYYKWLTDSLLTQPSNKLYYYLEVWDNDRINGFKSTRTKTLNFTFPERTKINDMISKNELQSEKDIDNALEQTDGLENIIKEAGERLKGKKKLTWQDENELRKIMEKKKTIRKAIDLFREQNKKSNLQKKRFSNQQERIKEKAELLQKLMDDLLDEDTKKLYEQLQKLLEESKDVGEIQENLRKLDHKEKNLEKELERVLELFRKIQLEEKLEEVINELEKTAEHQDSLAIKTKEKENSLEKINKQQEEIKKNIDEIKREIDNLNELNQHLKNPESIPDHSPDMEDIDQTNKDIQKELEKGKRKKGSEFQKNASEQLQQLADKMKQIQAGMQLEMMQENLDHLRDVVHSLIKLSFDQESLMSDFRKIDQIDPGFVVLSHTQIKLKDDAKILQDSLLSLSERVFQISSFVTREVSKMNQYMDESSVAIKKRQKMKAVSKQQFAMTSINNLALLLDDVLGQMQQQIADVLGKPNPEDKKSKNQPAISELQRQLNEKIKALKKGNKKGRQLSEELAKLAAEQEHLRRMLQQYGSDPDSNQEKKNTIKELMNKMEETEIDLVNKNITSETIKRQEKILTRMLQSEDALKQQEKDEKRESEQAESYDYFIPEVFEEYIKAKEKEIELLKTIPPKLYPHYKNEVSEYFERVNKKTKN